MTNPNQHIIDEAITWFVRLEREDASPADWEDFTVWLESSAANARAYDHVVAENIGLGELSTFSLLSTSAVTLEPANDNRMKWFGGIAVTASVMFATFWFWPSANSETFESFETSAGEVREIALGGNTVITLNGSSKIQIDMVGGRVARLERGEVLFVVEHDEQNPFVVEVGAERVVDAGTVFNIVRDEDDYSVSVAEGEVVLNPQGTAISVEPGERAIGMVGIKQVQVEDIEIEAVADWAQGQLVFSDTALIDVAAEIERNIGTHVSVDPAIQSVRFTGTLQLNGDEQAIFAGLAAMADIKSTLTDDGWKLSR